MADKNATRVKDPQPPAHKTKEQKAAEEAIKANPGQSIQTPLPEEEPNVDRTQVHKVEPAPTPGSEEDKALKEQLAEQRRRTVENENANLGDDVPKDADGNPTILEH